MAEQTTMTADQLVAQRAFPDYRVYGTGTIVVRKACCMEIELVDSDQAALLIKSVQCCRYCSMRHFIHYRKAAPAPTIITNDGYRK
jgi:hypothetical protein